MFALRLAFRKTENVHMHLIWLKKAFNARAQEDRERYYNDIAKEAEAALQRNDMKPIYRVVKRISGKESSGDGTFPRKLDGTLCKSEEEALLRWTEYYSTALNHPVSQPCPDLEYAAAAATDDQRIPLKIGRAHV